MLILRFINFNNKNIYNNLLLIGFSFKKLLKTKYNEPGIVRKKDN